MPRFLFGVSMGVLLAAGCRDANAESLRFAREYRELGDAVDRTLKSLPGERDYDAAEALLRKRAPELNEVFLRTTEATEKKSKDAVAAACRAVSDNMKARESDTSSDLRPRMRRVRLLAEAVCQTSEQCKEPEICKR